MAQDNNNVNKKYRKASKSVRKAIKKESQKLGRPLTKGEKREVAQKVHFRKKVGFLGLLFAAGLTAGISGALGSGKEAPTTVNNPTRLETDSGKTVDEKGSEFKDSIKVDLQAQQERKAVNEVRNEMYKVSERDIDGSEYLEYSMQMYEKAFSVTYGEEIDITNIKKYNNVNIYKDVNGNIIYDIDSRIEDAKANGEIELAGVQDDVLEFYSDKELVERVTIVQRNGEREYQTTYRLADEKSDQTPLLIDNPEVYDNASLSKAMVQIYSYDAKLKNSNNYNYMVSYQKDFKKNAESFAIRNASSIELNSRLNQSISQDQKEQGGEELGN